MGTAKSNNLTTTEQRDLAVLERRIDANLPAFHQVVNALSSITDDQVDAFQCVIEDTAEVRRKKLYRGTHATFEAWCQAKFGKGRNYINKLIRAAAVVKHLGTVVPKLPRPNERQARALACIEPAKQPEVWERTVEASDGKPTLAEVARQVRGATGLLDELEEMGDEEAVEQIERTEADLKEAAPAYVHSNDRPKDRLAQGERLLKRARAVYEGLGGESEEVVECIDRALKAAGRIDL